MPLDLTNKVAGLNDRYRHHGATAVLERALGDAEIGKIAMVSSFGAESVALLHLVSVIDRKTPVLFIDTEMLFAPLRVADVSKKVEASTSGLLYSTVT